MTPNIGSKKCRVKRKGQQAVGPMPFLDTHKDRAYIKPAVVHTCIETCVLHVWLSIGAPVSGFRFPAAWYE